MRGRVAVLSLAVALLVAAFATTAGASNPWTRIAVARPSDTFNVLTSIDCTSPTDCTTVGWYQRTDGTQPLVIHTRFGVWARRVIHAPSYFSQLRDVSCVTATTCTAVGSYSLGPSDGFKQRTLVLQTLNGLDWVRIPSPNPGGASSVLSGIDCVAATRCRAVGSTGTRPLVLRTSNGLEWFREAAPDRGPGENALASIDCVDNADCTAVGSYTPRPNAPGQTLVMHTTGGPIWRLVASPNPAPTTSQSTLVGVSCVAPSTCVAVGSVTPAPGPVQRAFVLRTVDGTTWTRAATPSATGEVELGGVHCVGPTDCTAVGVKYDADKSHITGQLLRTTDGTSWSSPNPPSEKPGRGLVGVDCVVAAACFGVGAFNTTGSLQAPFRTLLLQET